MFRPLQELENLAPGTWYVNVLALLPAFRSLGLGTKLLQRAEETARAGGKRGLSILVSDANHGARRLYERIGYRETARRPMVKEAWVHAGRDGVLLHKAFLRAARGRDLQTHDSRDNECDATKSEGVGRQPQQKGTEMDWGTMCK